MRRAGGVCTVIWIRLFDVLGENLALLGGVEDEALVESDLAASPSAPSLAPSFT